MMDSAKILKRARDVLDIEAQGILSQIDRLDDNFVRAVELLFNCKGKVVVTGMGKAGIIGQKLSA
ncbi:MAG: KpsF/GutQ family sugar-phosphate isomerase, partial [Candidatus Binatota bacterium]